MSRPILDDIAADGDVARLSIDGAVIGLAAKTTTAKSPAPGPTPSLLNQPLLETLGLVTPDGTGRRISPYIGRQIGVAIIDSGVDRRYENIGIADCGDQLGLA